MAETGDIALNQSPAFWWKF